MVELQGIDYDLRPTTEIRGISLGRYNNLLKLGCERNPEYTFAIIDSIVYRMKLPEHQEAKEATNAENESKSLAIDLSHRLLIPFHLCIQQYSYVIADCWS